jgi:methionyl-tRNA formyltransferase
MKITFISDKDSWKNKAILGLVQKLRKRRHKVSFVHGTGSISRGDLLIILGFFKIVPPAVLKRNKTNVVIHESALPKGRGWSPVTWAIIEGSKSVPLTLFEAVKKVDAGEIYLRDKVQLRGHELLPEVQSKVAGKIVQLCERFVKSYPVILKRGVTQRGKTTYYPRRQPKDSRLNPNQSVARQFNLLRSVNNDVYPAYFTLRGHTYTLKIEKKKN